MLRTRSHNMPTRCIAIRLNRPGWNKPLNGKGTCSRFARLLTLTLAHRLPVNCCSL